MKLLLKDTQASRSPVTVLPVPGAERPQSVLEQARLMMGAVAGEGIMGALYG